MAAAATAFVAIAFPAAGQDEAVGPCSPFRAADGDVPSEMPGCPRRLRAPPGSLADEMLFRRRARERAAEGADDDEPPVPRRGRIPRPR